MFCGKQLLSIFCGSNLMISGKGILHVWGDVTRSSFFRTLLTWLFFNRQISAASARKKKLQICILLFRSNVPAGSVFWWYILHLRNWGDEFRRSRSGRSDWSDDICLPSDDQVHLPQIWNIREHRKTRCTLYFAAQHCQRKNLHLHMVLAPAFGSFELPGPRLSGRDHI